MDVASAKQAVIDRAVSEGWGEGKTVWRLRDWGVSRQRYWGAPIPFIHCETCGVVPVPKEQLPVVLPEDVDISIPGNPLVRHPTWKHVECPKCGRQGGARDRHARHVRRQLVVLPALRQPAGRRAVRPGGRREVAAGRPVHRRHRARDPAPALRPLLDPRAGPDPPARRQGAVRLAIHPGHGDPRDLFAP